MIMNLTVISTAKTRELLNDEEGSDEIGKGEVRPNNHNTCTVSTRFYINVSACACCQSVNSRELDG